ncbi:MAG: hypothetical protein MUF68_00445 [Cyclobacteriaceae bacterium]|jgi:hypothetical protein|nr:hypothetical protein [Cyclobacteriaceae bacterium]
MKIAKRKPGEILVFKTSVETQAHVNTLRSLLNKEAGKQQWNFALDDADKIFRTTSARLDAVKVKRLFNQQGYICEEL